MTALFAGLGLLALGLLLLLWLPLRRPLPEIQDAEEFQRQDVAIYRERVAELESEHQRGLIDDARLQELQGELQRRLLDEVPKDAQASLRAGQGGWKLSAGLSLLLLVLAVYLYEELGARADLAVHADLQRLAESGSEQQQAGALQDLVTGLEKRVEQQPDNLQNRYLLARSYLELQRPDEALAQYREMIARSPEPQPRIMAEFAQLSFFANNRQLDSEMRSLLDEALALDPDNTVALGVLGIDAYEQGRFADAIEHWERVLQLTEPGPGREALQRGIASARSQLGLPALAQAAGAELPADVPEQQSAQTSEVELQVLVELAPELRSGLSGQEPVFIFARDPGGPPMPLAVARLRVADLPSLVRLNDSMAMMPSARLSQAETVRVQARVSLSGQPQGASGDLQGSPIDVELRKVNQVLRLLIDQSIP